MSSSTIKSPEIAKRDPLTDYDLVPSGIPIPIGSLKGRVSFPINLLRKQAEADYDIPKFSQICSTNSIVKSEKASDNCLGVKNLDKDPNIDRQIFV